LQSRTTSLLSKLNGDEVLVHTIMEAPERWNVAVKTSQSRLTILNEIKSQQQRNSGAEAAFLDLPTTSVRESVLRNSNETHLCQLTVWIGGGRLKTWYFYQSLYHRLIWSCYLSLLWPLLLGLVPSLDSRTSLRCGMCRDRSNILGWNLRLQKVDSCWILLSVIKISKQISLHIQHSPRRMKLLCIQFTF
jgi:hypothetical protein